MLLLASSYLICLARMLCEIVLYPLHTSWQGYVAGESSQVQYVELTRTNQRDIAVTPKVACSLQSAGF